MYVHVCTTVRRDMYNYIYAYKYRFMPSWVSICMYIMSNLTDDPDKPIVAGDLTVF